MSTTNRGTKAGRDKAGKGSHTLQNGKTDTSLPGTKIQPTAEQLRIAQITSEKGIVEPDVAKKVIQVCELTGRSEDEALVILHDCDYDVNRAIDAHLEKKDEQTPANDWQEISKKKKPTVNNKPSQTSTAGSNTAEVITEAVVDRNDISTEPERTQDRQFDGAPRGRRERGGPPRFQRGRGSSSANGEKGSVSRERPSYEGTNGRGGRRQGSSNGGGRGGFGRGYSGGRNNFNSEPRIDTWSNDKMSNGVKDNNTMAEWGAEEWTADEWCGSLEESRVFTASGVAGSLAHTPSTGFGSENSSAAVTTTAAPGFQKSSSQPSQVYVASSVASAGLHNSASVGSGAGGDPGIPSSLLVGSTSSSSPMYRPSPSNQDALGSGAYDLNRLLQQSGLHNQQSKLNPEQFNQEPSAAYLSRYAQEATEVIKNAVGIGNSNLANRSAINIESTSHGHGLSSIQPAVMQNCVSGPMSKQSVSSQQQRPRLPPPSKIPASAVEMPASMNNAQLDVQFGNWDIPTVAASVSSATENVGLSFTADLNSSAHYGNAQHGMSQVAGPGLHNTASLANYDLPATRSVMASSGVGADVAKSPLMSSYDEQTNSSVSKTPLAQPAVSAGYQSGGGVQKDFVMSKLVAASQQQSSVGYQSTPGGPDLKSSSYVPTQSSQQSAATANQSSSHGSVPSQLPFSQVGTYQAGMDTAPVPSAYKSTSVANTSAVQMPAFSSQQTAAALNQYSSDTSFSNYATGAVGSDSNAAGGLAAAVAAAQYSSYTGISAPGFGTQQLGSSVGSGSYVGPNQGQSSSTYAASSNAHMGVGSKAYGSSSNSTIGDKQQVSAATYSANSLSSQSYEIATNSYQFGAGQLPSTGSAASGNSYQLSNSGPYPNSGQLSYQNVPYNQSSGASGFDTASAAANYGPGTHSSYPSNVYTRQMRDGALTSGSFQQTATDALGAAAGYHAGGLTQAMTTSTPTGAAAASSSNSKLSDNLGKLALKDGAATGQYDAVAAASALSGNASVAVSLSTATSTTPSASVGMLTTSTTPSSRPTSTSAATTKSSTAVTSKALVNIPVNGPVVNNYMIAQPPGFQVAAFGYPTAQQYTYEDFQLMQSQQRFPLSFYDMPYQPTTTMTSAVGAESTKLAPMDPMSPVALQPTPAAAQQSTVPGSAAAVAVQQQQQQSYLNPAMHPAAAGYSAAAYYYPQAAGIMPVGSYYPPVIQMGGLAVPLATNPATTQYQKAATAAMYGSHAGYNVGGQTQDFSKTFGASQTASKGPSVAAGSSASTNDVLAAGGAGFSKNHVQTYEKSGFHSGTPPPQFVAAQTGAALGGGYGAPYMSMIPHQSHNTQILHHQVPQDASIAGRGTVPQNQAQQSKSASVNKGAGFSTAYWGSN